MSRNQAGAIPFRREAGRPSFCLITTSGGTRWGFPKGIIEPGDTARETALKETLEEAGLRGEVVGEPVGTFEQAKWGSTFTVEMYLMEVTGVEDVWDEQDVRQRRWCEPDEAAELIRNRPVTPAFVEARRRLAEWLAPPLNTR